MRLVKGPRGFRIPVVKENADLGEHIGRECSPDEAKIDGELVATGWAMREVGLDVDDELEEVHEGLAGDRDYAEGVAVMEGAEGGEEEEEELDDAMSYQSIKNKAFQPISSKPKLPKGMSWVVPSSEGGMPSRMVAKRKSGRPSSVMEGRVGVGGEPVHESACLHEDGYMKTRRLHVCKHPCHASSLRSGTHMESRLLRVRTKASYLLTQKDLSTQPNELAFFFSGSVKM